MAGGYISRARALNLDITTFEEVFDDSPAALYGSNPTSSPLSEAEDPFAWDTAERRRLAAEAQPHHLSGRFHYTDTSGRYGQPRSLRRRPARESSTTLSYDGLVELMAVNGGFADANNRDVDSFSDRFPNDDDNDTDDNPFRAARPVQSTTFLRTLRSIHRSQRNARPSQIDFSRPPQEEMWDEVAEETSPQDAEGLKNTRAAIAAADEYENLTTHLHEGLELNKDVGAAPEGEARELPSRAAVVDGDAVARESSPFLLSQGLS